MTVSLLPGLGLTAHAHALAARIAALQPARPSWAKLVAISGIDAAGKGTLAAATAAALEARGLRVALIGLDDWHEPAERRFGDPAGPHFYRHAFDFETVFSQLIEPLRFHRALRHETARPHPHTGAPRRIAYDFADVDVVIVEGVFLLRRDLRARYDLRVWLHCPYETALQRALARNQEGLAASQLVSDYRRIYFPAQELHLAVDRPRDAADVVVDNRF